MAHGVGEKGQKAREFSDRALTAIERHFSGTRQRMPPNIGARGAWIALASQSGHAPAEEVEDPRVPRSTVFA